ncbi:hypothetical protein LPW36_00220 [Jinshanibacter sp. LJY008]|uniref:Lipoprotein n=1 Tax=Limnobaculum eriocheiris TaxID=2897391 RepID=A0A9X1MTK2_9GAMM|nr:hypothetical protein [Limnobaculum eriocheiris]MCD1124472.1 hypothetical protein [Limnobaculum eriocheiris]
MSKAGVLKNYSRVLSLFIGAGIFLSGCSNRYEQQQLEFAEYCAQVETLGGIDFSFSGFTYDELKEVEVKHQRNGEVIEQFSLHVDTYSFKSGENNFSLYDYSRQLHVRDKYTIRVSDQQVFVLNGMKTKVIQQPDTRVKGDGCHLSGYSLNGVSVESYASPLFAKLEVIDHKNVKKNKKSKKRRVKR